MFARAALPLVNHVLAADDWARERLATFAGKTASVHVGAHELLRVAIDEQGLLRRSPPGTTMTVRIELPSDAPARLLGDRATLFSAATIAGSADLAETLGLVFRNLHWDVEEDLSQVFGDIVARRGLQLGRQVARWHWQGANRLAAAVAEYLTEEQPEVAHRRDVEHFCGDVDTLRDDLARLEKRLARLEAGRATR
ncbi:MAG TPA: hypothetical protein PK440_03280 [Candidatus Accumulibacter phosphatis]|nr:MAG: hypothetical protein AW07_03712 [Candidatus Accumulibacter sp. SK-11]HCN67524.1 hypothetical protein [Accumulibacter sp.]HRL75313.1 hypothetical protein [Candidatus Accumulibacter phosphatis]HRQ94022.1 hypothetical protein [Candidatus Accumulibacter phosphatis]